MRFIESSERDNCTRCLCVSDSPGCTVRNNEDGCNGGLTGYYVESVSRDKKYDEGKAMMGLMRKDFAKALEAVATVTTYGVKKYNAPGSWRLVPNAPERYDDALCRHDVSAAYEDYDEESGLLHAAHRAWNALAVLEMLLEKKKVRKE